MWSRLRSVFKNKEVLRLQTQIRQMEQQSEADRTAIQIEQRKLANLISQLTPKANPLAETIALREAWPSGWSNNYPGFGSVINPTLAYMDGLAPLLATVPTMWDYTLNLGFYVTEAWLDVIRMYARVWFATTPQAQGVIRGLRNYVIHTGFEYQVQPKPDTRVAKELPLKAQRIVDDFLSKNNWYETERDWFLRLHRDGEVFPRLNPQDDGCTQVRTIEPWQVRGENTTPENLFGVITPVGDREGKRKYRVSMSGSGVDEQFVDGPGYEAQRMCQFKINTDLQTKRGVSDFLCTQQLFRDLTKLMTNTQVGEALRQALVWTQQTTGAAATFTETFLGQTTAPGYGMSAPNSWEPGQIPTMDKNLEMKPGPVGNTENARVALTLAYQALSVYFAVPEWMISGTSDANFASSLTQESPLIRSAQSEQKCLKNAYGSVVEMALKIAEEQDFLEAGSCDKLMLNIEAPPLVVREPAKETDRNKVLHDDGILSKKTWSVREELERETELENIVAERTDPVPTPAPTSSPANGKPSASASSPAAVYADLAPRP